MGIMLHQNDRKVQFYTVLRVPRVQIWPDGFASGWIDCDLGFAHLLL